MGWPNGISTLASTLLPGIYYFYAILPQAVSPQSVTDTTVGMTQSILGIVIIFAFVLAAFTNPGIVPRQEGIPKGLEDHRDLRGMPSSRFLRINGICIKQKWCSTC